MMRRRKIQMLGHDDSEKKASQKNEQ